MLSKVIHNRFFKLLIEKQTSLQNELLSGLTVSLALVPEAIAFAFVARVDPVIGLYAAFIMGIGTALFGGRPGMISGATGAVAVIFAPLVIQQTALVGMEGALSYLFVAVIVMGFIQILIGVLKFGKFIRLVPHPVMLGFVNGLAIIILKSQLDMFFVVNNGHHALLRGMQRARNGCCGRIADMTVPEALRVDTDGAIKPDMAFLALLCECKPGILP